MTVNPAQMPPEENANILTILLQIDGVPRSYRPIVERAIVLLGRPRREP